MGRSIVGQYGQATSAPQFKSIADPLAIEPAFATPSLMQVQWRFSPLFVARHRSCRVDGDRASKVREGSSPARVSERSY